MGCHAAAVDCNIFGVIKVLTRVAVLAAFDCKVRESTSDDSSDVKKDDRYEARRNRYEARRNRSKEDRCVM